MTILRACSSACCARGGGLGLGALAVPAVCLLASPAHLVALAAWPILSPSASSPPSVARPSPGSWWVIALFAGFPAPDCSSTWAGTSSSPMRASATPPGWGWAPARWPVRCSPPISPAAGSARASAGAARPSQADRASADPAQRSRDLATLDGGTGLSLVIPVRVGESSRLEPPSTRSPSPGAAHARAAFLALLSLAASLAAADLDKAPAAVRNDFDRAQGAVVKLLNDFQKAAQKEADHSSSAT